jgi:hypothetical protein
MLLFVKRLVSFFTGGSIVILAACGRCLRKSPWLLVSFND